MKAKDPARFDIDALRELARDGWDTVAMTPAGNAPPLRDVAATLSNRVAIVLGHEGEGLTDMAIAACTHRARIAMSNGVDSVNVATAAAIAFYVIAPVAAATARGQGA